VENETIGVERLGERSLPAGRLSSLKSLRNPSCDLCPLHKEASTVCVFGEGSGRLPVMILGEAPGREEDRRGRPFVGPSGKLLRSELLRAGLPLKKCYLTNTVKCYPKGTPTDEQERICSQNYLRKEISTLNPIYVLTVGAVATRAFLPTFPFSEVRGQINESWLNEALVFPIWHPAYILRTRSKQTEWQVDIENFVTLVEVDHGKLC